MRPVLYLYKNGDLEFSNSNVNDGAMVGEKRVGKLMIL